MVKEIVWSPLATETFDAIVDYIFINFGEAASIKFVRTVEAKLALITTRPKMFRRSGKKPNTFTTTIHKRTTLTYRYRPVKKRIELVVFWGMQNPANKPR